MHKNDLRDIARYILRGHGHHPSDVTWLKDHELIEWLAALNVEGPHADLVNATIELLA